MVPNKFSDYRIWNDNLQPDGFVSDLTRNSWTTQALDLPSHSISCPTTWTYPSPPKLVPATSPSKIPPGGCAEVSCISILHRWSWILLSQIFRCSCETSLTLASQSCCWEKCNLEMQGVLGVCNNTIDGSETRRSPVVYPIICRVLYIHGGCYGFLPSTVSWD